MIFHLKSFKLSIENKFILVTYLIIPPSTFVLKLKNIYTILFVLKLKIIFFKFHEVGLPTPFLVNLAYSFDMLICLNFVKIEDSLFATIYVCACFLCELHMMSRPWINLKKKKRN